jgi:hypothetical protein
MYPHGYSYLIASGIKEVTCHKGRRLLIPACTAMLTGTHYPCLLPSISFIGIPETPLPARIAEHARHLLKKEGALSIYSRSAKTPSYGYGDS